MIEAYKEGAPDNGKLFPEGSKTVKIEWLKKQNPESPYFVEVPDVLRFALLYREGARKDSRTRTDGPMPSLSMMLRLRRLSLP